MKRQYDGVITLRFPETMQEAFQKDLDDKFQDFFERIIADNPSEKETLSMLQSAFLKMSWNQNHSEIYIRLTEEELRTNYKSIEDKFQNLFDKIDNKIQNGDCICSGVYEQEIAEILKYAFAFSSLKLVNQNQSKYSEFYSELFK